MQVRVIQIPPASTKTSLSSYELFRLISTGFLLFFCALGIIVGDMDSDQLAALRAAAITDEDLAAMTAEEREEFFARKFDELVAMTPEEREEFFARK